MWRWRRLVLERQMSYPVLHLNPCIAHLWSVRYNGWDAKLTKILMDCVALVNLVNGYCLSRLFSRCNKEKKGVMHWHWFKRESKLKKKSKFGRVVLQLFPVWEGLRTRALDIPPDMKPIWSDRLMRIWWLTSHVSWCCVLQWAHLGCDQWWC